MNAFGVACLGRRLIGEQIAEDDPPTFGRARPRRLQGRVCGKIALDRRRER
jgi:hypothetical protein